MTDENGIGEPAAPPPSETTGREVALTILGFVLGLAVTAVASFMFGALTIFTMGKPRTIGPWIYLVVITLLLALTIAWWVRLGRSKHRPGALLGFVIGVVVALCVSEACGGLPMLDSIRH